MNTQLTKEQSARLIELGVDAKLASKKEFVDIHPQVLKGNAEYVRPWGWLPRFTLTDILSILQEQIGYANLTIKLSYEWRVTFTPYVGIGATPQNHVFKNRELIDALNQLLIWAIENNHINLNTDKK